MQSKLAALALVVACSAACGSSTSNPIQPPPVAPVDAGVTPYAFPEPPIAQNTATKAGVVEVSLNAAAADLPVTSDTATHVYAYNGSVPGPTLDFTEGDHVVIHFKNDLPEPTTVHWHGLHIAPEQDGNPSDPIAAGASHDYEFDIPKGSAGTYWYHPHPDGKTAHQVAMGLAGAIRVRAAVDPLPREFTDTLMILSDNKFDSKSQVMATTNMDKMNGREGDVVFVNGKVMPTLTLRAGEVRRLRIVNASSARFYQLAVPDHSLLHVGTDGGLFEVPVTRSRLLVAPGERVEVLLQATSAPGTTTVLQAMPYNRGAMIMQNGVMVSVTTPLIPFVSIVYADDAPVTSPAVPATLRKVDSIATAGATARTFTLTEQMMQLDFRINDKHYDAARVDEHAQLGATEIWTVENKGDMAHPFHVHGFQFQVLDRNGVAEPFVAWKDTVLVRNTETLRLVVKLDDFRGMRMYHCHILDHEDLGMMGMIDVQ